MRTTSTTFQPGTILVESGTLLPGGVLLPPGEQSANWSSASLGGIDLAAEAAKAGWTFFYMAGEVCKYAFGFDREKRERTAVGRVIADVQTQNCNCLQITALTDKSFLGIPYVSITAHARHIQSGSQFRG